MGVVVGFVDGSIVDDVVVSMGDAVVAVVGEFVEASLEEMTVEVGVGVDVGVVVVTAPVPATCRFGITMPLGISSARI